MPSPDSSSPPDAAAWLARGQSLEAQATPAALAAAAESYACAVALLRAIPAPAPTLRCDLALAHLHHGNALQKIATPESVAAALVAYDATLTLLSTPDFTDHPAAQNTLGAAWINRGHALHRQATAESLTAAVAAHRAAIAVLQPLPLHPSATTTPEAALHHRLNLAGAWVNLANTLLESAAVARRHTGAREAATHALDLLALDDLPAQHPGAAELSLFARRARCDALGYLIFAVDDVELAHDLTSEAGDLVDDGLALVRQWEQRGLPHFRPLAARLYHFGAQLYRLRQPHFLAEFLLEHLDAVQLPGAIVDDPVFYAIADEAVAQALQSLQSPHIFDATRPHAARQLATSRDLKSAATRLATLRAAHLPPTPITA